MLLPVELVWMTLRPRPVLLWTRRLSSSLALPSSYVTHSAAAATAPPKSSLFEQDNLDEYHSIPLSTLDHPPIPRTPTASLVRALRATSPTSKEDADALRKDLVASHSVILSDPAFAKHAVDLYALGHPTWIEWHRLTASSRPTPLFQGYVEQLLYAILSSEHATKWDDVVEVAKVSTAQWRQLAWWTLLPCTAYSPLASEQLFSTLEAAQRSSETGTASIYDKRYLRDLRGRMLRLHLTFGRTELAVQLAEKQRGDLDRHTTLELLSSTALSDDYPLFERAYRLLPLRHRVLLLPTQSSAYSLYPYFIRTTASPSIASESPSAQEAFTTFRYSSYTSSLEEGPSPTPNPAHNTDLNDLILSHLSSTPPDLTAAYTTFIHSLQSQSLPALQTSALLISAFSASRYAPLIAATSSLLYSPSTATRKQEKRTGLQFQRSYWAAALMLSHLHLSQPLLALRVLAERFWLDGLPPEFRIALRAVLSRLPETENVLVGRKGKMRGGATKVWLTQHAFGLTCQALVPLLQPGGEDVRSLLEVMLDPKRQGEFTFPSSPSLRRREADFHSTSTTTTTTRLDSYTFLPFLQSFSSSPLALLDIFARMDELGVGVEKEHWGVLLGSWARLGDVRDVRVLMDILDPSLSAGNVEMAVHQGLEEALPMLRRMRAAQLARSTSSSTSPSPIDDLLSSTSDPLSIFSSAESRDQPPWTTPPKLDQKAFTAIIQGLSSQREWKAARKVARSFKDSLGKGSLGDKGERKGVDERMGSVLRMLRKGDNGEGQSS